jgi:hypothetical protein
MAEQYGTTDDGRIESGTTTWAGARDVDTGATIATTELESQSFTVVNRFGSRGGGNTYRIGRTFIYFDTSSITGTVASAQFEIVGSAGADGSIIAVKSTAFGGDGGTALAVEDFDAMPGWTDGASQAGNVTTYSVAFESSSETWSTNSANVVAGTSDLLADMKNNDVVIVCFMDYTYDYLNVTPTSNGTVNLGGRYAEASSSGQRPRIDYTLATGYGHIVSGVAATNIGKVDGVATANIEKVIGV